MYDLDTNKHGYRNEISAQGFKFPREKKRNINSMEDTRIRIYII